MIIEMIKRIHIGFGYSAIITFVILSFMVINDIEVSIFTIWLNLLASMVMGGYFGIGSFIFENENWSPLKKTIMHFSLSIVIYYLIAIPVGWVPFTAVAMLTSGAVFIVTYLIFWFASNMYFKRIELSLNNYLKKDD